MTVRIEILKDGSVLNTIEASEDFAEQHYPGAWRLAAEQDDPSPEIPDKRWISVGAFFDRFGAAKWPILSDADPMVQAVIKDANVRKYIDLDRSDLPAGLAIIQSAGHEIDPSTILGDPIHDYELP